MKKVLLIIALFLISIPLVHAIDRGNRLYFTEENDRLYYESSLIDENVFMKHIDMVPGKTYTDTLIIENGTNTKYKLFFQVLPREQSELADELLENIKMKVSIDGNVIYEGMATGLDYDASGMNLQNVVPLGEFSPSKTSEMVVETTLSEDYSNTENNEYSYIDWSFYGQYENSRPTEIVDVPNTMKNSFPYIPVFSILIIVLGLCIIKYATGKEKK